MKTYTQEELKEILELHQKWLNNEGGIRANLYSSDLNGANLSNANLSNANLCNSDLSGANLKYANLSSSDLSHANLKGANLSGANLKGSDLSSSDLSHANLKGANLSGANLLRTIGDMQSVKSFQVEKYMITYTDAILNIGCRSYTIDEWNNFTNKQVSDMDNGSLEWWSKWKPIIMQIIKMSPAESTLKENND